MSVPIDWNCRQINTGDNCSVFVVVPYGNATGDFVGHLLASGTIQKTIIVDADTAARNPDFKEGEEIPLVLIAPRLSEDGNFHVLPSRMVFPNFAAAHEAWQAASSRATHQASSGKRPDEKSGQRNHEPQHKM
jgi:hypothetical protein